MEWRYCSTRMQNFTDVFMVGAQTCPPPDKPVKFHDFASLSSQIPFKIGNLTDFKASFLAMLTEFHLLVPIKIWKQTQSIY